MYFQPDDDLVFRQDIRRNRGAQGCGHCLDYSPLAHANRRQVRLRRLCSRRRKYQREREYLFERRGLDVHYHRRFRELIRRVVAEGHMGCLALTDYLLVEFDRQARDVYGITESFTLPGTSLLIPASACVLSELDRRISDLSALI